MTSDQKYSFLNKLAMQGILRQFIDAAYSLAGNMQDDTFLNSRNHIGIVDHGMKAILVFENAVEYYRNYPHDNPMRKLVEYYGFNLGTRSVM